MFRPHSVAELLAPVRVDDFFADVWEQRSLHLPRNDPGFFGELVAELRLEEVLWQTCHKWGDVSLAGQHTAEAHSITARPPALDTIRTAFSNGYTVVVNHLERKNLAVARLCRSLEREWYYNTHVNLYVTSSGTQGLRHHYDDDDVLILQLSGTKRWRIHGIGAVLPLPTGGYIEPDRSESNYSEYSLHPGDVLYLPRGFVHEAMALEDTSVHLTVTVSVIRWVTLLQELLAIQARSNVELRKGLPVSVLSGRDSLTFSALKPFIEDVPGSVLTTAVSEARERLLASKHRLPLSHSLELRSDDPDQVTPASVVEVAADQIIALGRSDEGLTLQCVGASLVLPIELEKAVTALTDCQPIRVDDLPGEMSTAEKVGLARALIASGVLSVSDGGQPL